MAENTRDCYTGVMSALLHTVTIMLAVIAAYIWLQIPWLHAYSLQAFSLCIVAYFLTKRLSKAALWHIAPSPGSLEMPIITFSLLILIGSTGNVSSMFYPLSFGHLFFLVLACQIPAILLTTVALMLFHIGLTPELTSLEVGGILSLPLLMLFFLFTKYQYSQVKVENTRLQIEQSQHQLSQAKQNQAEQFLAEYVQPKLMYLQELARFPEPNRIQIQQQLEKMQLELAKLVKKMNE